MNIVNIRKKNLNNDGYEDLRDWLKDPNHVYIGRNMSFYVFGAVKSKWSNPFSVKKHGRHSCLKMYKEHVYTSGLINDLHELHGKVLGCWCAPEPCHGHVLEELLQDQDPAKPKIGTVFVTQINDKPDAFVIVSQKPFQIKKFKLRKTVIENLETEIIDSLDNTVIKIKPKIRLDCNGFWLTYKGVSFVEWKRPLEAYLRHLE